MSLERIFIEPSSKPIPDLSLHISPPSNSSSPSSSSSLMAEVATATPSNLSVYRPGNPLIELSLARKDEIRSFNGGIPHSDDPPPRILQNPYRHFCHHSTQLNNEASVVDVSDGGYAPIKGIPVYPNRPLPFLPVEHLRTAPFQSSSSLLSHQSVVTNYFASNGLDRLVPDAPPSTASAYRISGRRFNGLASSSAYQPHYHHHHHHENNGTFRSRYFQKMPAKRGVRAPRMRWTSTLHARFVHAVELLGGHESTKNLQTQNFPRGFVN